MGIRYVFSQRCDSCKGAGLGHSFKEGHEEPLVAYFSSGLQDKVSFSKVEESALCCKLQEDNITDNKNTTGRYYIEYKVKQVCPSEDDCLYKYINQSLFPLL